MTAKIGEDCINCGMCHSVCAYNAIVEGGSEWLDEKETLQDPVSEEHYFVIPWKCRNCGKCLGACPMANITMMKD
ncbi:MAG: 4Fe-4S dicluster domain-containing protein [Cytophagales bacterium]|nr:4Fe-4S dicluster domain-containing protein [Cytophagales bacterium]